MKGFWVSIKKRCCCFSGRVKARKFAGFIKQSDKGRVEKIRSDEGRLTLETSGILSFHSVSCLITVSVVWTFSSNFRSNEQLISRDIQLFVYRTSIQTAHWSLWQPLRANFVPKTSTHIKYISPIVQTRYSHRNYLRRYAIWTKTILCQRHEEILKKRKRHLSLFRSSLVMVTER